jgi:hypothetical protein
MNSTWEEYLTVDEIAKHLKLNHQTIRNWIAQSRLPRSTSAAGSASDAPTSTCSSRMEQQHPSDPTPCPYSRPRHTTNSLPL